MLKMGKCSLSDVGLKGPEVPEAEIYFDATTNITYQVIVGGNHYRQATAGNDPVPYGEWKPLL